MFAFLDANARIENISLHNVEINAQSKVAGLAADNRGTIRNSRVVNGNIRSAASINWIAGLVGVNSGVITNSRAIDVNINANSVIGGLVGLNIQREGFPSPQIIGSFAIGGNLVAADESAGGLVGVASQDDELTNNKSLIRNSYATNSVSADSGFIGFSGGLVGESKHTNSEIINSYATGNVAGTNPGLSNGGLQGGVVAGSVSNSYWDSETSEQSTSQGGIGQTTVELQTGINSSNTKIYSSWDTDHWYFGNDDQYPTVTYAAESGCREPSTAQLASCASRVPAALNAADRAIICRDQLAAERRRAALLRCAGAGSASWLDRSWNYPTA